MSANVLATPYEQSALGKHESGSVRELFSISFPLMLSLLSGSLMLFFDRLFLAQFSLEALNASTNSTAMAAAIQFGFISTACIAEIFVGRYNGAGKFSKLGQPVWQMIWFSLMTAILFIPLAFLGAPYLFAGSIYADMEAQYFMWLMLFGPVFSLVGALCAFYIGRGSLRFVTLTIIFANTLNIFLDYVLIFGWEGHVTSMGISGAAIATGISQAVQCAILFTSFLSKNNREKFGTGKFAFNWKLFKRCLKLGLPNSSAHTIEIFAWAVFFRMMTTKGEDYITVAAVTQTIYYLFCFITEGISKGSSAVAANMIGAKQWDRIWTLFFSGVKLCSAIFIGLGFFLVLDPEPLINLFLPSQGVSPDSLVKSHVTAACFFVWIYFFFESINWLVIGLLTAAGDTKFVFKVGCTTVWLFAVLPIYFFINVLGYEADVAWKITVLFSMINCAIYLSRFKSERWKTEALAS